MLSRVPDVCFTTARLVVSPIICISISRPELTGLYMIGLIMLNVGGAAILSDVLGLIFIRVSPLKI